MTTTRCKFQLIANLPAYPTTDPDSPWRRFAFEARYDHSLPEDARFSKATPTGRLDIITDNPAMTAGLKVGDHVYVDVSKIEDSSPSR